MRSRPPPPPREPEVLEGTITRLAAQRRDPSRVSVYLDDAFAFGLHADLVLEFGLHKGMEVAESQSRAMLRRDATIRARSAAFAYVAYRPRTTVEVRRALARKGFEEADVDAAVARLEELGYLDDAAFARRFAEERMRHKRHGPTRIRADLRRKGISAAHAQAAVSAMLEEADPFAAALALAQKRWPRLAREADARKRRKRLSDFLLRRGYTYETVRAVVEAVDSDA